MQVDFGRLSVISLYLPSGTSKEERQVFKYDIMERLKPVLTEFANNGRDYVICGDWNIAHRQIDLRNWRANQKNSGFLPDERLWMDWVFDEANWVDIFRTIESGEDQYTWWSNRGQSWAKNVGWRIDYQIGTPQIAAKACRVEIFKDERFSDHAPLIIDYKINARWLKS